MILLFQSATSVAIYFSCITFFFHKATIVKAKCTRIADLKNACFYTCKRNGNSSRNKTFGLCIYFYDILLSETRGHCCLAHGRNQVKARDRKHARTLKTTSDFGSDLHYGVLKNGSVIGYVKMMLST